jgi:SAM-dependent methyltransferase
MSTRANEQSTQDVIGMPSSVERANTQLKVLRSLGTEVPKGARVLDLGCGNGGIVDAYVELGYDAYGCDFQFKQGPHVDVLRAAGRIKLMDETPYRLPFENGSFDLVVSDQVLEHVQDYGSTFAEVARVLKPGGQSLHVFPSRYSLLEPHVHVPLGTVFRSLWWLRLWAALGVRKREQQGLVARDVARANHAYLASSTNYLPRRRIAAWARKYFATSSFCEREYLLCSNRAALRRLGSLPFVARAYGTFRDRVLVTRAAQ